VAPGIDVDKIVIHLDETNNQPTVEVFGRLATGNRRFDMNSSVLLKVGELGQLGKDFILELKAQLRGEHLREPKG